MSQRFVRQVRARRHESHAAQSATSARVAAERDPSTWKERLHRRDVRPVRLRDQVESLDDGVRIVER